MHPITRRCACRLHNIYLYCHCPLFEISSASLRCHPGCPSGVSLLVGLLMGAVASRKLIAHASTRGYTKAGAIESDEDIEMLPD
jgi:hypothetical protein